MKRKLHYIDPLDALSPFSAAMAKEGTTPYIRNVTAAIGVVRESEYNIPLIINTDQTSRCWTASPFCLYIDYAREYFSHRLFIPTLLRIWGALLGRQCIDKIVSVDDNLASTILHPSWIADHVPSLSEAIRLQLPNYAIVFRSILPDSSLYHSLKSYGYLLIPWRPVYLTDTTEARPWRARMWRSDLKAFERSTYQRQSIGEDYSKHIADLYYSLNIDKHSLLNPQYTAEYFTLAARTKELQFEGFFKGGVLHAVLGYRIVGKRITAPVFGYDPKGDDALQLYRLLNTRLALIAKEKRLTIHHSSGADTYKRLRRASPSLEYLGVFIKHLSLPQRISWNFLSTVVNTLGPITMQRK